MSHEDFKVIKVVGKGAFGMVYLVHKKDTGQSYAMKLLKKEKVMQKNQLQNTKSERIIMEQIKNPFIVQLHYSFESESKLYFVLDYLPGGELFYHLRKEQRFSEEKAKFYAAEILLALKCLHENNIIYRDLKPENVLLDAQGHIKLTDFGLSKIN